MKKMFYIALLLSCVLNYQIGCMNAKQTSFDNHSADQPTVPQEAFNRLNWVETHTGRFSTQIMFDFSNPVYFKKKIVKEAFQLRLTFPGIKLAQFSAKQVMTKLSELKKYGIIKNVQVIEKNKNIPKVVLMIDFEKTKQVKNNAEKNIYNVRPNRLLIKWYKMEDPNRLVIDIFTQENLEKLKDKNETILFAKNDIFKSDVPNKSPKIKRIVLDPGHGGSDTGAQYFDLVEKTLALDIAKRARSILEQNGYTVMLTRQQDCTLSLLERSNLAEQLKADMFISIHVNSTKKAPTHNTGIETFYLQNSDLVTPTRRGGFLFVNLKNDTKLIELIDNYVQANTQLSQSLAKSIQSNLINYLKTQKININNRGVKSDKFRVLLRSPIPAALVEVGFITNKNDAHQLSEKDYREKLAYGICKGITQFIQQQ